MVNEWLKSIPALVSRLSVGWVFAQTGWGKVQNLAGVTEYFQSLGIPLAQIQAPMVAGLELICGILLLLGLFTRFAAIPLVPIMTVAILTAKLGDINAVSDLFSLSEFLFLALALWLIAFGGGKVSLDAWIQARCCKPAAQAT